MNLHEKLLTFGGEQVAEIEYPERHYKNILSKGELFVPEKQLTLVRSKRFQSLVLTILHEENIKDGVPCSVELLHRSRHECYRESIAWHRETGDELLIGYGLKLNTWVPHAACYDPDRNVLIETVWPQPGFLYYMVSGWWEN